MTPEQWERLKELLQAAWELDSGSRTAFLDGACGDDPALRSRVESLLACDANIGEFLAAPAIDWAKQQTSGYSGEPRTGNSGEDALLTGTRIGRYSIDGLIGRGGMGVVYRAVREDDFRRSFAGP